MIFFMTCEFGFPA